MPINAGVEYFIAKDKYEKAKTREDRIRCLEEMIRAAPSHKGAEKLRAELKSKLSKLKSLSEKKMGKKRTTIPKIGDIMIAVLGVTQVGKSTLLSNLTNARPKIAAVPYTTIKPEQGMADWKGVKIQLVEIPSTFESVFMSIAQNSDGIIIIARNSVERHAIDKIIEKFNLDKPKIYINDVNKNPEELKVEIWRKIGRVRVYCKEPGKKPEEKPLVLKDGGTVLDVASDIHKDFIKYFRFARIWGSGKYPGEMVGKDYKVKDGDIVEIHIS